MEGHGDQQVVNRRLQPVDFGLQAGGTSVASGGLHPAQVQAKTRGVRLDSRALGCAATKPELRQQLAPGIRISDGSLELCVRPAPLTSEVRGIEAEKDDMTLDEANGPSGGRA
jgi:hypothetical protein